MTPSRDGTSSLGSPGRGPGARMRRIAGARWRRIAASLAGAAGLLLLLAGCGRQAERQPENAGRTGATAEGGSAAAGSLLGDQAAPGVRHDSGDVVQVELRPTSLRAKPGRDVVLLISLDVEKPWHLYAHEDTAFYGVDLAPAEDLPLDRLQVSYPAGEPALFFGQQVLVLAGRQEIRVAGRVPADLAPATYPLAFELAVQACDDRRCLAPAFLPVRGELEVLAAPSSR
jgi:hypothetical protein